MIQEKNFTGPDNAPEFSKEKVRKKRDVCHYRLNVATQNSHVQVPIPSISEYNCIWS